MAGCIAHARNGRISTSGEKSNVNIVLLDPDFLKDAKILAIRLHLRQITYLGLLNTCMGFQDLGLKWGFCGGAILTHNKLVLPFGGTYVCANFGEN